MKDNTTPYDASQYDRNINTTIPYYQAFYEQTMDVVWQHGTRTGKWLDLGCGTGTFEAMILECFPEMEVLAVDPSEQMLKQAAEKVVHKNLTYRHGKSSEISVKKEFDVVPEDEEVKKTELLRWGRYQVRHGKTEEEALVHNRRCGVNYFPLTVQEHIRLLKEKGFAHIYVFWKSYMQMGIYAIK